MPLQQLEEMPVPDTVYRTPTVFQMEPINIQVIFLAILQVLVAYIFLSSVFSVPFKLVIFYHGKDPC